MTLRVEGERPLLVEEGEGEEERGRLSEGETLTSCIYSEDDYRVSTGFVGPRPFLEVGLIVCPPPKIDLWRRAP